MANDLDDLLLIARTKAECERILKRTLTILTELGWIINMKKSRIIPQQKFTWIGVEYILLKYTVHNSEQNLAKFYQELLNLPTEKKLAQSCNFTKVQKLV